MLNTLRSSGKCLRITQTRTTVSIDGHNSVQEQSQRLERTLTWSLLSCLLQRCSIVICTVGYVSCSRAVTVPIRAFSARLGRSRRFRRRDSGRFWCNFCLMTSILSVTVESYFARSPFVGCRTHDDNDIIGEFCWLTVQTISLSVWEMELWRRSWGSLSSWWSVLFILFRFLTTHGVSWLNSLQYSN